MKVITHNRPTIDKEEICAVVEALSSLELTVGTKAGEFEDRFSRYIGIDSVATSSGTSALHLALIAAGVNRDDEVILPSYTCAAVAYPVLYQQARPVLVDTNYSDYNIDLNEIKNSISDRTKAVVVPHMFGYPADIQEIKEFCCERGVFLIEDCAQSIGSLHDGRKVGVFGDISIFSFYATKMVTSIQGGMVCTDNKEWIETARDLRYHDQQCSLSDARLKYSYMMSDINAAVGIEQLKKLDNFVKRRREIAGIYRDEIINVEHPVEEPHKKHAYSRYVVKTESKDEIIQRLRGKNIICATMHSPPLHRRSLFASNRQYPNTEKIINTSISLPIYPSLEDEEILNISDTFNKIRAGL
ncbi:putative PLP-dependent enzyme possibly involved in cell wall biogenesis [Candidatus Methanoperedens nitroreducens]|uniref:Putative PLP-dependent enzyme possibly involved in cell wall biogenesis n=1 Tax=Candidatus Methanoperedens nitratireducens TaxID=1392998 RepID=A0A062V948_9EURY|nr:DegT/DnrJ/EryC1/StrS family aminotransferase [Candidatus Methanoperedens nitroreducens]KCZ72284.1 putative PLP-dependent enzyme possibly involved in cell wall biogenesis [Candidatus Methanoperedens nitroreducens]MDJ1420749.1 DegT/DnrJ/EryC1/StrS family aminotransferase [Candidatus Methanoperedens sp.]